MSDSDELDLKIEKLRNMARKPADYSAQMNALLIAKERAQERAFKKSLSRRSKLNGGKA